MNTQVLKNKGIVLVSTVPYFMVSQLSSQIEYFLSLGMDVTIITSEGEELVELPKHSCLRILLLHIPRKVEIFGDFLTLCKLIWIFRKESFDILHSFTPKAGLLCAIAGWATRIPLRFHTFTGQAWVTRTGLLRKIMRASDKLIVQLMKHCYADSHSQRDFLIAEDIGSENKLSVMGYGSLGGVDTQHFSLEDWSENQRNKQKETLGVQDASCVYIYIGRMTVDKGIHELLDAFERLQEHDPQVHLLLVGPVDDDGKELTYRAVGQQHVHYLGYQEDPVRFLAVADILCLPSYREGFGTVVIEAAAMGIPCIGTNIQGLVDAIEDGETGTLVSVRNSVMLYKAMKLLGHDKHMRERMGDAARCRVIDKFDVKLINEAWANEYIYSMNK